MLCCCIWTSRMTKLREGWQIGMWSWEKQNNIKHRGLEDNINWSIAASKNPWFKNADFLWFKNAWWTPWKSRQRHGLQVLIPHHGLFWVFFETTQVWFLLVQLQEQEQVFTRCLTVVPKSQGEGKGSRVNRKKWLKCSICCSEASSFGTTLLYWSLLMAGFIPTAIPYTLYIL